MPLVDETDGALRRLRAGEVELVIVVETFGRGAAPADDLHRVHLLDDEYRVLLPDDHPLARRRIVDLPDLASTDWIVTTGPANYIQDATMTACLKAGFTPRVVAEADEFAVTQGYVAAGLGVSLVPALGLAAVRDGVLVKKLRTPPDPRHIWLATRTSLASEPAVHRMISALKAAASGGPQPGPRR
jgi:DNA-binding transcriptional LysR family regulator